MAHPVARAETVATKPSFREAFKHNRCIIPLDGYYEWKAESQAPAEGKGEGEEDSVLRDRAGRHVVCRWAVGDWHGAAFGHNDHHGSHRRDGVAAWAPASSDCGGSARGWQVSRC